MSDLQFNRYYDVYMCTSNEVVKQFNSVDFYPMSSVNFEPYVDALDACGAGMHQDGKVWEFQIKAYEDAIRAGMIIC